MTSEGLGEMFEGNSADTHAGKFLLVSMGGRAEGLGCADPGARLNNLKQCNLKLYLGFLLGKELENLICFIK